ncbi:hypothetical protein [Salibacterium aidingense]|uniref:hypothetical protein n=1 Tax=Salibacterium aidingense TaxID=384933 RepID=UPI003BDBEC67
MALPNPNPVPNIHSDEVSVRIGQLRYVITATTLEAGYIPEGKKVFCTETEGDTLLGHIEELRKEGYKIFHVFPYGFTIDDIVKESNDKYYQETKEAK